MGFFRCVKFYIADSNRTLVTGEFLRLELFNN